MADYRAPSQPAQKAAEIVRRVARATPDRSTGRILEFEARLILLEDIVLPEAVSS